MSHQVTLARGAVPLVVLALAGAACGSASMRTAEAEGVVVRISPASATVEPLAQRQFSAAVAGAADRSVTWSVVGGDASGTVDGSGLYRAPAATGSYQVVARSTADPTKTGQAAVTVAVPLPPTGAVVADHTTAKLALVPAAWIDQAKQRLHIAYGHTSHGSQITDGMTGLAAWKGSLYAWNGGGTGGALDLRDYYGNFGGLGMAEDLGNPSRTAWEAATRAYLAQNPTVNVIVWSWCYQVNGTEAMIDLYLDLMDGLQRDFPGVKFVHMTGHLSTGADAVAVNRSNAQIRAHVRASDEILFDFADIESWDPDGNYFLDRGANDNCDYDTDGNGTLDGNWAIEWQAAHPGEWFPCTSAHSQPLNANLKAYAAWWLWARLAGWDGVSP